MLRRCHPHLPPSKPRESAHHSPDVNQTCGMRGRRKTGLQECTYPDRRRIAPRAQSARAVGADVRGTFAAAGLCQAARPWVFLRIQWEGGCGVLAGALQSERPEETRE